MFYLNDSIDGPILTLITSLVILKIHSGICGFSKLFCDDRVEVFGRVGDDELPVVFFVEVIIPGSLPVILVIWHEMAVRLNYQIFQLTQHCTESKYHKRYCIVGFHSPTSSFDTISQVSALIFG